MLTAEELRADLSAALRVRGAWPAGLVLRVDEMPPEEVEQLETRPLPGQEPLSPTRTIGFRLNCILHRTTREVATQTTEQLRYAIGAALHDEATTRWQAMFEGTDEPDQPEENRERPGSFSWSQNVYLEIEQEDG